jgi:general secretion pathway protein D
MSSVRVSTRRQKALGDEPRERARPLARRLLRVVPMLLLACLLTACNTMLESRLPASGAIDLSAKGPTPVKSRQNNVGAGGSARGSYELFTGSTVDGGNAGDLSSGAKGVEQTGDKFSINVDGADIGEVSKLVLGDTLGFSYLVDPRVQGTITLSTVRPMSANEVLSAFEAALRLSGATLISQGGLYKVIPLQEVLEGEMGTAQRAQAGAPSVPGYGVTVIPLRFIAPSNMLELLDSFIARSGTVRASNIGSLLLVRGSGAERQQLVDVVLSFDVDWMRAQTASIALLANSKPADMVSKLQAIFAQDSSVSGGNALRVIPLERLNGVVIIATSREKVRRALVWVGRLDRESNTETNYYVYNVQNGDAVSLAKILNATFLEKSGEDALASQVEPSKTDTTLTTGPTDQTGGQGGQGGQTGGMTGGTTGQDQGGGQTPDGKTDMGTGTPTSGSTSSVDLAKPDLASGIRITPNPDTNTLIIRATPQIYAKMLGMLKQLDKQAVQVLVNATIVEVSLNDNLQYGVQAYFKSHNFKGGFTNNANSLLIRPNLPGLNLLLGSIGDPRIVIDALSAVTKVKVVSSPSLVVLENEAATIKVGDSTPILTQQQQGTGTTSNIVNSVEYRDSGVILKVKPRISANGMVTMDISQELSSVSGKSDLGPTFSQRTVASTVTVQSSQTVVLGGMISGVESLDKNSIPVVNKVPVIGDVIGSTDRAAKRNELILFLTPQIIESGQDASQVSEELRDKMRLLNGN